MATKEQIASYCQQQLHMVYPSHWSTHNMSTFEIVGISAVVIYFAGRIGLPTLWSDIKSIYASIRGMLTKATPVTPVA